jgi:hypothetical protein
MPSSRTDVDIPADDADEATGIGHSLAVSLPESTLEVGWFNLLASGVSEHFQWRVLPIIAAAVRPVLQPVVISERDRLLATSQYWASVWRIR